MLTQINRPTKVEQKVAIESYSALTSVLSQINTDETEIEINDRIKVPLRALELFRDILKAMGEGTSVSVVPVSTDVTTQKAAEILGCSRPYVVKLLEEGKIAFVKVGKHRRIMLDDVLNYKQKMKEEQKRHLIDIMNFDEETGLYDS